MTIFRQIRRWLWLAALIAITFGAHCWNWREVFIAGQTYFVDGDCYARMTRVQRVLEHPFVSLRFHDFENAPQGTVPHTTAPLDFVIAALSKTLDLVFWLTSYSGPSGSLDLAGAFVSPLLSVAFIIFLWWWAAKLQLPYRNAMLLLVALSPILTHGFLLGRPDHQALTIPLIGAALAAELALWKQTTRKWDAASGILWALALWVSLFEPLILLGLVLLLRLVLLRKLRLVEGRPWGLILLIGILLFALLFDGWRGGTGLPAGYGETFKRWATGIGELNHVPLSGLFLWTGWMLLLAPVLLFLGFRNTKDKAALALLVLLLCVTGLTLWHARWGYYLALCFALGLPWALPVLRWKALACGVFVISLWPMARAWDAQLFPNEERQLALAEKREDAVLLREAAVTLIAPQQGVVLAPWWLSPPIAYWSGQTCVAGSSHQSLPGIVDTARFYLATQPEVAREILLKRSVTFVLAYEPSRVIDNSTRILGTVQVGKTVAQVLYQNPNGAPDFLRLAYANKYFRVFEVRNP